MTRREAERLTIQADRLRALGFTRDEAEALRRISMTLQRWFEQECGSSDNYGSWSIERDENGDGPPFMVHHHYSHGAWKDTVTRTRIADRETGARKRLARIVDACNKARRTHLEDNSVLAPLAPLAFYVQTDPRGAALYILRAGDVPAGGDVSSYYTRGICVY